MTRQSGSFVEFCVGLGVLMLLMIGHARADSPATRGGLTGWAGPADVTRLAVEAPVDWRQFEVGEPSRLVVLLTGEEGGSWLPMVEGLRALGVPVTVTRDWQRALRHRMVIVYPTLSGRTLEADALAALRAFPASGGTLVGFEILGGGMAATFGLRDAVPSRKRFALHFLGIPSPVAATASAATAVSPRTTTVPLGDPGHPELGLGSYAYPPADAEVLARYDTGEPALLHRGVGLGHAYAVGVDIGDFAARGFQNHQQGIARSYVNEFEPAVDVLLHWLKDRYLAAEPHAVTLATAPQGKAMAVMITHDLDYLRSLRNAQEYLAFERAAGIRATYFLQTKYIRDWEDEAFLDDTGIGLVRALVQGGMELGSHSVAHSRVFARMPLGTGEERFPAYRPRVTERLACDGCTILGELRVSRYLAGRLAGTPPVSFRAGHLANPRQLPEALLATGFRFGSDSTANDQLTHLPVHAHFSHQTGTPVEVFEFPVTIEDEQLPRLGDRLDQALVLAEQVIADEGIFVVLIHPDVTGHKLRFEQGLVRALQERVWFGTLGDFGRWWVARDQVSVDIQSAADGGPASLHLVAALPIEGLTLQLPPGMRLEPGGVVISSEPGRAVLGALQGEVTLPLQVASPR